MSSAVNIQLRGDSSNNWNASDPIPLLNEVCLETDTGRYKVGDGAKTYKTLSFFPQLGPTYFVAYDTTAALPSAPTHNKCMAWASDINLPCYSDGTKWYKLTGTNPL
jgi:hypothetical protein